MPFLRDRRPRRSAPVDVLAICAMVGCMSTRRAELTSLFTDLGAGLIDGPGVSSPAQRRAASVGTGEGALGAYARQLQAEAYRVSPELVEDLRAAHGDDVVFEVTLCAAWGASRARHERALAALDAAWEDPA